MFQIESVEDHHFYQRLFLTIFNHLKLTFQLNLSRGTQWFGVWVPDWLSSNAAASGRTSHAALGGVATVTAASPFLSWSDQQQLQDVLNELIYIKYLKQCLDHSKHDYLLLLHEEPFKNKV